MMSHWSKGAAGAGYTGKVPAVQATAFRVRCLLSDTELSPPPNESAHVQHEFVLRAILIQIILKLVESASSFPGERA